MSFNPTSSLSFPHVLSQVPNKHKFSLVLFMYKANLSGTDGSCQQGFSTPEKPLLLCRCHILAFVVTLAAARWIKFKRGFWLDAVLIRAYDTKFFISLFERVFKMMKNGVYFIVIALLAVELFKILVYAN